MTLLFKKLNYKNQEQIFAIKTPYSFENELISMSKKAKIIKEINKNDKIEFMIGFVSEQSQIDELINLINDKLFGDSVIWLSYPKSSSKNYKCEFNRDNGFAILGQYGLEPVRQVAIDQDWSALRFRKVEYIKNITRKESFALTAEAKKRTTQKGK